MPDRDVGIEDRLRKLREDRVTRETPGAHPIPVPDGKARGASVRGGRIDGARGAPSLILGAIATLAVLAAGAAILVQGMLPPAGAVAQDGTDTPPSFVASIIGDPIREWIGGPLDLGPKTTDPVNYLPHPPADWARMTQIDAAGPSPLLTLQSNWPHPGESDALPLNANFGYAQLQKFIALHARPGVEAKVLARKQAAAIYLGQNGCFVHVLLKTHAPLGPAGDPQSWLAALEPRARDGLAKTEVLETGTLAGFGYLNRALSAKQSRQAEHETLRMLVPLSPMITVEIQGVASLQEVETLLRSVDLPSLVAELD